MKGVSEEQRAVSKDQYVVIAEFRYQLRCFIRHSEELAHEAGITPLQYQLLLQTRSQRGRDWVTIGELAERLQAQHHGVVALVDRCVAAGLVQRRTGRADRRQVEIHLTARGRRILEKLVAAHRAQLLALEGRFAVPDRRALGA